MMLVTASLCRRLFIKTLCWWFFQCTQFGHWYVKLVTKTFCRWHRCWWRILEKNVLVTSLRCWWPIYYNKKYIMILSPASKIGQHHKTFINITLSPTIVTNINLTVKVWCFIKKDIVGKKCDIKIFHDARDFHKWKKIINLMKNRNSRI